MLSSSSHQSVSSLFRAGAFVRWLRGEFDGKLTHGLMVGPAKRAVGTRFCGINVEGRIGCGQGHSAEFSIVGEVTKGFDLGHGESSRRQASRVFFFKHILLIRHTVGWVLERLLP